MCCIKNRLQYLYLLHHLLGHENSVHIFYPQGLDIFQNLASLYHSKISPLLYVVEYLLNTILQCKDQE